MSVTPSNITYVNVYIKLFSYNFKHNSDAYSNKIIFLDVFIAVLSLTIFVLKQKPQYFVILFYREMMTSHVTHILCTFYLPFLFCFCWVPWWERMMGWGGRGLEEWYPFSPYLRRREAPIWRHSFGHSFLSVFSYYLCLFCSCWLAIHS